MVEERDASRVGNGLYFLLIFKGATSLRVWQLLLILCVLQMFHCSVNVAAEIFFLFF